MKSTLFFLYLFFLPLTCFCGPARAITFGGGSRLGDNILDYTHAKWLSYKYDIPLLLNTFVYSDQFVFFDVEKHLTPEVKSRYNEVVLNSISELKKKTKNNVLYYVSHFPDSIDEYRFLSPLEWIQKVLYIPVDWNDKKFRGMMQNLIAPKYPLKLIKPPKGIVSVALHFRTGGDFALDSIGAKRLVPLRFPEPEYYIEQFRKLLSIVKDDRIYVHIFTDHSKPDTIRAMFKEHFPQNTIQFAYRDQGNRHDANVLEDLFSMLHFDCLIRPVSHYSITASHLGDFKIELYPKHGYWQNNKFVVDNSAVIVKQLWDPKRKIWLSKL